MDVEAIAEGLAAAALRAHVEVEPGRIEDAARAIADAVRLLLGVPHMAGAARAHVAAEAGDGDFGRLALARLRFEAALA